MEYGKILNRSANIVWQNKFLIVLGILASLGGSSFPSSGGGGGGGTGTDQPFGEPGQFPGFEGEIAGLAVGVVIALICVALIIGIALWVVSTIARGGLIAGVDAIETGEKSSFSQAWGAGWRKARPLLGIGLIPAIPGLILFIMGMLGLVAFGGFFALFGEEIAGPLGTAELGIIVVLLLCIVVPIALILSILRNFAERACMLENHGVIDSYKRGWNVLTANLGEAIILFLIQIGIAIALGLALFVPGIILALCCFLWPLLFIVQGAISAFVSSLWTLAWRTWTGKAPMVEKEQAMV
jgi:hypothetical protein